MRGESKEGSLPASSRRPSEAPGRRRHFGLCLGPSGLRGAQLHSRKQGRLRIREQWTVGKGRAGIKFITYFIKG